MVRRSFAMVCSSNLNRSMEAHALLKSKGFQVILIRYSFYSYQQSDE